MRDFQELSRNKNKDVSDGEECNPEDDASSDAGEQDIWIGYI